MADFPELLLLISELTSLLAAAQKLADMLVAHKASVARMQAKLDATPTQC
jgi:uncharacterized coiled-coil protein SlyX